METKMKKIIAISGSVRKGSLNCFLLSNAKDYLKEGVIMDLASIRGIPLYDGDEEAKNGIPETVQTLKEKIIAADAVLVATPEYNHSIPGTLKNAIDYLTRPPKDLAKVFSQKKFGLIGASVSPFATCYAQTAWLPILRYLNVHPYFGKQLYVTANDKTFTKEGKLVDEAIQKRLSEYMKGFCEFILGED